MTGIPTDHKHDTFAVPAGWVDPLGRPVDTALLGQFVGAAFDGCTSCQDPLLTLLTADPVTVGRLVELACQVVHDALGGLPPNMLDPAVPGMATAEFRELAAAGSDGQLAALHARCAAMTDGQRRAAANSAADLLVGYLSMGRPVNPGASRAGYSTAARGRDAVVLSSRTSGPPVARLRLSPAWRRPEGLGPPLTT